MASCKLLSLWVIFPTLRTEKNQQSPTVLTSPVPFSRGIFWPVGYVGIPVHLREISEEPPILTMRVEVISTDYTVACRQLLWFRELRDEKE